MTQIQISPEQLQGLSVYETSIARWSLEHASLTLTAKRAIDTVESLYVGRQKSIDKILTEAGIDTVKVLSVKIDPTSSTLSVELNSAETPGDPAPKA